MRCFQIFTLLAELPSAGGENEFRINTNRILSLLFRNLHTIRGSIVFETRGWFRINIHLILNSLLQIVYAISRVTVLRRKGWFWINSNLILNALLQVTMCNDMRIHTLYYVCKRGTIVGEERTILLKKEGCRWNNMTIHAYRQGD